MESKTVAVDGIEGRREEAVVVPEEPVEVEPEPDEELVPDPLVVVVPLPLVLVVPLPEVVVVPEPLVPVVAVPEVVDEVVPEPAEVEFGVPVDVVTDGANADVVTAEPPPQPRRAEVRTHTSTKREKFRMVLRWAQEESRCRMGLRPISGKP